MDLNAIRIRNEQYIQSITIKQQEAVVAKQVAETEAVAALAASTTGLVAEPNVRKHAQAAADCVATITQIVGSIHAEIEVQTRTVKTAREAVATAAVAITDAASIATAAEAAAAAAAARAAAAVESFVLGVAARKALMECKGPDEALAEACRRDEIARQEVQIAIEHLAAIIGIYDHIVILQGSAAGAAESAARLVAPYQYTIDKQQIQGLPESYYGVYVPTRTTPSLELIYDFRILDFHDIKNYKKLIILNLAMIIAEKLKIEVFRGCLELEDELKFFCFLGFDNRFRYNSDHVEQERLSRLPYIEIKEDSITRVPFLRIYNYCIEEYRGLVKQKIYLNFFDFKFFQKININNRSDDNSLNLNDTVLISKFDSNNYIYKLAYRGIDQSKLLNSNILPYNFIASTQNYFLSIILINNHLNKNNNICIELLEDEFLSLIYNCLPTPIIRQQEIDIGDAKVAEGKAQGFYNDINGKYAVAIDPSFKSKDKDDAIFFEENDENNLISMYIYISDVSPYMNEDNLYIFNYAAYKKETEYIGHNRRYPLLDPFLSENRLSLMGNSQDAIQIKIDYEKLSDQTINKNPLLVTVQKVQNLKIIYTTYKNLHNTFITENRDLKLLKNNINKTVISNNFSMKRLDEITDLNGNDSDGNKLFGNISSNKTDHNKFYDQICLMHKCYKIIGLSVDTINIINTYLDPFSIKFNNTTYGLEFDDNLIYDKWIHTLIEITALEVNKYIGIIQYSNYDFIELYGPKKIYSITRQNIEAHLNLNESNLVDGKGFYRKTKLNAKHKWNNMTNLPKIVPLQEQSVCYREYISQNYIRMNDQWVKKEFMFPVSAENVCKPELHFNINSSFYSWFTSPLRRFFDLAVHNLLFICVDKKVKDKFIETYSIDSKINDLIKKFEINKNLELLLKRLSTSANNIEKLVLVFETENGARTFINLQFFIFNSTISFPNEIAITKGYNGQGFYYIKDLRIIEKNNVDFNLEPVPLPANQTFDNLIINNMLSFFQQIDRNEYTEDIINFSHTSCVKDFMEGRFGGYKNGKNGKNNVSFREKYLKYKLKYLALKNNLL